MAKNNKQMQITRLIKKRIASGVYLNDPIPSERAIAAETGVSYMTARKAVQQLLEAKVLDRAENGRLTVRQGDAASQKQMKIVLVAPAFGGLPYFNMRMAIDRMLPAYQGVLNLSSYRNWYDPALMSVFDGDWDGIFIVPPATEMPQLLLDRMVANRHRVVSVYEDMSQHGIVSLDNSWPGWMTNLVAHMISLGHKRVDCLNTQPGPSAQVRIEAWKQAIAQFGIEGRLFDKPVEAFTFNWADAYEISLDALSSGQMAPAVICTSITIARGLSRAAYELKLNIGKDLMYCAFDSPYESIYETPSVTTINHQPLDIYVQRALEWLSSGQEATDNQLRLFPDEEPELLLGESTGFTMTAREARKNLRSKI